MSRYKYEDNYLNNIRESCNSNPILMRYYNSLMWYVSSARFFKRMYYCFNIISTLTPLIGTILTICLDEKWYSIISAIGALSVTLLNLFQCQKHWKLYRNVAEKMKRIFDEYLDGRISKDEFGIKVLNLHNEENINWHDTLMQDDKN